MKKKKKQSLSFYSFFAGHNEIEERGLPQLKDSIDSLTFT